MRETRGPAAERSTLLAQVEDLARTIAITRTELRRLDAGPLLAERIPSARDELAAVVAHTAVAADKMLDVGEDLERMEGRDDALLQRVTTQIFEACSFQDLTSQRIAKVVGTLEVIENRLEEILGVFGGTTGATTLADRRDDGLVNGPQLPAYAMRQAEVDRLLAD